MYILRGYGTKDRNSAPAPPSPPSGGISAHVIRGGGEYEGQREKRKRNVKEKE